MYWLDYSNQVKVWIDLEASKIHQSRILFLVAEENSNADRLRNTD
jgi:hypothetical protein